MGRHTCDPAVSGSSTAPGNVKLLANEIGSLNEPKFPWNCRPILAQVAQAARPTHKFLAWGCNFVGQIRLLSSMNNAEKLPAAWASVSQGFLGQIGLQARSGIYVGWNSGNSTRAAKQLPGP